MCYKRNSAGGQTHVGHSAKRHALTHAPRTSLGPSCRESRSAECAALFRQLHDGRAATRSFVLSASNPVSVWLSRRVCVWHCVRPRRRWKPPPGQGSLRESPANQTSSPFIKWSCTPSGPGINSPNTTPTGGLQHSGPKFSVSSHKLRQLLFFVTYFTQFLRSLRRSSFNRRVGKFMTDERARPPLLSLFSNYPNITKQFPDLCHKVSNYLKGWTELPVLLSKQL